MNPLKPRIILAIETSTRSGSVALMKGDQALEERFLEEGAVQGRQLAPGIRALLDDRGLQPDAVDLITVGLGPGSYTGLRVGIIVARAFAYAARCEVVGVSSFAALAASAREEGKEILCVAKAGRDEYYHALFIMEGGLPRVVMDHAIGSEAEVTKLASPNRLTLCDGTIELPGPAPRKGHGVLPSAGQVALLGLKVYLDGGATPEDLLMPLYLRRSKAEINWERREAVKQKENQGR